MAVVNDIQSRNFLL